MECHYHTQGPLNGGVSNLGVFPIWIAVALFCPFWDFPDFSVIVPMCPFPLSRPINSICEGQCRKGPQHNPDLSRKNGKPPGLENPRISFSRHVLRSQKEIRDWGWVGEIWVLERLVCNLPAGLDTMAEDLDQLKYDVGELKELLSARQRARTYLFGPPLLPCWDFLAFWGFLAYVACEDFLAFSRFSFLSWQCWGLQEESNPFFLGGSACLFSFEKHQGFEGQDCLVHSKGVM